VTTATAAMIFDGLPSETLQRVLPGLPRRDFPPGARVIAEGERLHEMLLVEAGTAEVTIVDRIGASHQVNVVGPGDVLGEMSLFTGRPASATVRALEEFSVIVLTEDEFHELGDACPKLYQNLGSIISRKLYRADRAHLGRSPAQVVAITDTDAEPLSGYGLACSLAWHTRAPIVLVAFSGPSHVALTPFRSNGDDGWLSAVILGKPLALEPRAYVLLAPATDALAPGQLGRTLERLTDYFRYVLVQGVPAPGFAVRRVPAVGRSGPLEHRALRAGLLPPTNAAGRELGRIARGLAQMQVGVALGAGGMKGFAHIGVLAALEQAGVPIDFLAGCSVGALVAALYASGHKPGRIAELLEHGGATGIRPILSIRSVFSDAPLRRFGREVIGPGRIEDLSPALAIVAADILTGEEVVFRNGSVWPAILASCAIPGVLPAQRIGGRVLVDGGIVDPVPGRVAADMGADVVLAVNLRGRHTARRTEASASQPHGRVPAVVEVITRSIDIMQSRVASPDSSTSIAIEPDCAGATSWDLRHFGRGVAFVPSGEAAVWQALPRIADALPWVRT
jgi:NTE family protein